MNVAAIGLLLNVWTGIVRDVAQGEEWSNDHEREPGLPDQPRGRGVKAGGNMSDFRHLPVGTRVRVGFALIYEKVPGGMWRSRRRKALHNWITDEQLVEVIVGKRKEAEET